MALSAKDHDRLVKLLGMFSSTFDGEVVNAARAAHEVLRRTGFGWVDVLKLSGGAGADAGAPYSYQRPPQPPRKTAPGNPADPVHWVEACKACQEKLFFVLTTVGNRIPGSFAVAVQRLSEQRSRLDMIRDKVKRYEGMDY